MRNHRLRKVLIANRGEIVRRIQRACRSLGISTVSVASSVDRASLFAREAEELVVLEGSAPAVTYLNVEKLLEAARNTGCDAVHPGYGFLSENSEFARRVIEAGLTWIGPAPESIRLLGDKTLARERVSAHGVPCAPASAGGLSDEELLKASKKLKFPLLIKAASGGGGRGMRVVRTTEELREMLPRARAEALKFFANADVFVERYIEEPRHVEVQVFGDEFGNLVHFGTRDCSTQRRHQKLVEEAPAPFLSAAVRKKLHDSALKAAKSVGYYNAGTVEFLVKGKEVFFLEMNTRIQVEHPVTEVVCGVDLVQLQLKIAAGEKLPMKQKDIRFNGHAIEYRVYAEDPANGFRPAVGKISRMERPKGEVTKSLREDGGFESGDEVSPYYDALLSKLIVHGATREEAVVRSEEALKSYRIEGLPTTLPFHRWLLRLSPFREQCLDNSYLDRHFSAEQLRLLKASEIHDPEHRGANFRETFSYQSEAFGYMYTVELEHLEGGDFLACPLDKKGKRSPPRHCRRSNGRRTALNSVFQEVLEAVPPKQVFSKSAIRSRGVGKCVK